MKKLVRRSLNSLFVRHPHLSLVQYVTVCGPDIVECHCFQICLSDPESWIRMAARRLPFRRNKTTAVPTVNS
jgi:hypothetical protein